mmetsp:Transcript_13798/g.26781  ORF Transcript_13798/g.26781 Transcript_13798/m.26781 type:complete len:272 (-) Transcript_13798:602-1417(-)
MWRLSAKRSLRTRCRSSLCRAIFSRRLRRNDWLRKQPRLSAARKMLRTSSASRSRNRNSRRSRRSSSRSRPKRNSRRRMQVARRSRKRTRTTLWIMDLGLMAAQAPLRAPHQALLVVPQTLTQMILATKRRKLTRLRRRQLLVVRRRRPKRSQVRRLPRPPLVLLLEGRNSRLRNVCGLVLLLVPGVALPTPQGMRRQELIALIRRPMALTQTLITFLARIPMLRQVTRLTRTRVVMPPEIPTRGMAMNLLRRSKRSLRMTMTRRMRSTSK